MALAQAFTGDGTETGFRESNMTSRSLCLALACVLTGSAADWPGFLGPTRDGVSPETGLLATLPAKGPPMVWEREVGEGYSGPVVAGGSLVLFHRVDGDEVIECLEAATGKGRWKFPYPSAYRDRFGKGDGPRATPLIADNHVWTLGAGGVLSCVALADGTKLWQRDLSAEYGPRPGFFGVGTTPLLEGGRLLVNVGAAGAGVVAFDPATGKELWKSTDQGASYASPVAATIDGVRHAIFFTREGILSLDPATGAVRFSKRWRSRLDASVNAATPLVVGDLLFVTASYGTGAMLVRCKKDGIEEVWKGDGALSSQYATPVVRDGYLYGCDGRSDAGTVALRCLELKSGKVRWSKESFGCSSVIAADGRLILLTEEGDLVIGDVSPEGFRELARATVLTGPVRALPALSGGRFYARDNRRLVCWDLRK
jgi:outer membrane protein assembly factor BamB